LLIGNIIVYTLIINCLQVDIMAKNPIFITFEGGDGVGKSTQVSMLSDYLNSQGIEHILTREPGGVALAEEIRTMLRFNQMEPLTELLLIYAARKEHVEKKIKPALANNLWVICDRFIDSSMAYQAYGDGIDQAIIEQLNQMTIGKLLPDITFILSLPPELAMTRITERNISPDKYDDLGHIYKEKIYHGFLDIAQKNNQRCKLLDASSPKDKIHQEIIRYINNF